ncbi:MAG: MFS transporter [Candidatus Heimdallarchaeota archaeon]|nr:MFS transporter [Candidatus Heimdallarchaeota archaeon]
MSLMNQLTEERAEFTSSDIKRNIHIFQITAIDITVLLVPVIVLLWQEAGLHFHEMIFLQGLFVLPLLLLEVPSGSIADYWSRKGSLTIFHGFFGLAMLLYAFGNTFLAFAMAEIVAGIGLAFATGSDTALIYDSLLIQKQKDVDRLFGQIMSQRMTITFVGAAIGAILGGYIATFTLIRLPIFFAFLGHILQAILVYFGYREPPCMKAKSPKIAIGNALNGLFRNNELKLIIIFSLTGIVFGKIGFWAVQHRFVDDFFITPLQMGFILSGFNIVAATSSMLIRSKIGIFSYAYSFFFILVIDMSYLWALIAMPNLFGVFIISLSTQVTRGIRTPLMQSYLQQKIASNVRATFSSIISFTGSLVYIALTFVFEIFAFSRDSTLAFCGLCMILVIFGYLALQLNITSSKANPVLQS